MKNMKFISLALIIGLLSQPLSISHADTINIKNNNNHNLLEINKKNISREDFTNEIMNIYTRYKKQIPFIYIHFDDVNNPDITNAAAVGLIKGNPNQLFRPNDDITREEASVIINRLINKLDLNIPLTMELRYYNDNDSISKWSLNSMEIMDKIGVITANNGYMNPKDPISKNDLNKIKNNLIKLIDNHYKFDFNENNAGNIKLKNFIPATGIKTFFKDELNGEETYRQVIYNDNHKFIITEENTMGKTVQVYEYLKNNDLEQVFLNYVEEYEDDSVFVKEYIDELLKKNNKELVLEKSLNNNTWEDDESINTIIINENIKIDNDVYGSFSLKKEFKNTDITTITDYASDIGLISRYSYSPDNVFEKITLDKYFQILKN